jgi:putative nucleotidyltransferase with HDIG domain
MAVTSSRAAEFDRPLKDDVPWWDRRPSPEAASPEFNAAEVAMAERITRRVAEGRFTIPQIPATAIEAMNLLARTDSDLAQISKVVSRDQRLAADLLATANSAMFGGEQKATNLPQALMRVGFRRARGVLLSACLKGAMYGGVHQKRAERLWRHSCAAAVACARIARNLGLNADDLYLCGLFHDVGKIVVLAVFEDETKKEPTTTVRPSVLDELVERLHEQAGAEVAMQWDLPDDIVDVVERHREAGAHVLSKAQAVAALADACCRRLGAGAADGERDDDAPIVGGIALAALGVEADRLPLLLDGVKEEVEASLRQNA